MKQYSDSPAPINNAFDVLALIFAARNGDYAAYKRINNLEAANQRHRKERAEQLWRRRTNDIEMKVCDLRKAVETADENAEAKAIAEIWAIHAKMSEADQKRAWESIVKMNFLGNAAFLDDYFAKITKA